MPKKIILALFTIVLTLPYYAQAQQGIDDLNRFLADVNAYSAEFSQVVLDENLRQIDEAAGTLTILRPGRFRWDYYPPEEQQIIGDGDKVWIYDIELKQVIVRDQKISLGQTPAILLAGDSVDLGQFTIEDRGLQGKVHWISISPHSEGAGFDDIQIGFIDSALSVMTLVDGLGQTTRINFKNGVENQAIPAEQLQFVPSDDVDVIDETQ